MPRLSQVRKSGGGRRCSAAFPPVAPPVWERGNYLGTLDRGMPDRQPDTDLQSPSSGYQFLPWNASKGSSAPARRMTAFQSTNSRGPRSDIPGVPSSDCGGTGRRSACAPCSARSRRCEPLQVEAEVAEGEWRRRRLVVFGAGQQLLDRSRRTRSSASAVLAKPGQLHGQHRGGVLHRHELVTCPPSFRGRGGRGGPPRRLGARRGPPYRSPFLLVSPVRRHFFEDGVPGAEAFRLGIGLRQLARRTGPYCCRIDPDGHCEYPSGRCSVWASAWRPGTMLATSSRRSWISIFGCRSDQASGPAH